MAEFYLTLDAGTSGGKASIGNSNGAIISFIKIPWTYYSSEGMELYGIEFHPDEFWRILLNAADTAIKKAKINSHDIQAIAVTSQRQGCVFVDNKGKELYAGPNRDARGLEVDINDLIDEKDIYTITGHGPPFLFPLARLLWFKENDKSKFDNIKKLLTIDAWMVSRLTNQYFSEETSISESLCYDINKRAWATKILDDCGLVPDLIPPLRKIGDPITPVKPEILNLLNLNEEVVVTFAGADTQASLIGCGAVENRDIGIVAGSSMPIQFVSEKPIIDPEHKIWTSCFYKPNTWILESNAGSTGTIHEWFINTFLAPFQINNPYEYFEQLITSSNFNDGEVYADLGPQIMDSNKITQITNARFSFPSVSYSLSENINLGVFARSIVENIAFIAKANINQIIRVANQLPERFFLVGGLARSKNLAQILANVLKKPIYICDPEGASIGGFIAGMVANKKFSSIDHAITDIIKIKETYSPVSQHFNRYDSCYAQWKQFYDQNRAETK